MRLRFAGYIEFKSPTNSYHVSKAQYELMEKYSNNSNKFILSNDYDEICIEVHDYMKGVRLPCKYCIKHFYNNDTRNPLQGYPQDYLIN